jgi:hypothetical protein
MLEEITHIEKMLSIHHRPKKEIMKRAILDRLDKSLYTYQRELDIGVLSVSSKSELNVLKKL